MCTSIALMKENFCFGRTLDLDCEFGDGAVITPRNYVLELRCGEVIRRHYAFIGMASVIDEYALYADGMNEHGVCIAALEFAGNAHYPRVAASGKKGLAPFEIIPYLLGVCKNLDEVRGELNGISIVDVPFNDDVPNSALHWHIADASGSLVLESTKDGVEVYENPYGVLANNPPFPFHRDNCTLYLNSTNRSAAESGMECEDIFCNGVMGRGIPGDYTSPSRFVRAAWLNRYIEYGVGNGGDAVFAILGCVAPPRGVIIEEGGGEHYVRYTAVMDKSSLSYAYKRGIDTKIHTTYMKKESLDAETLI